MKLMELRNISKSYGLVNAVKDMNLTLSPGSILCVAGRNGSGKSTLLKIAALLIPADSGSIVIDGRELDNKNSKAWDDVRRESLGYSFQEPLLVPYLTTLENSLISSFPSADESLKEEEARRMLTEIGLSHRLKHPPSKLSGGERKKVDLVRALLKNPQILVADEPLSGLDPDSIKTVINMLRNFVRNGGSLICSAVDPEEASWADSVMLL